MKKIILFLFCLFLSGVVEAKVYYSEYGDYELSETLVEESDVVKVKVENKYLLFKETVKEMFYPSHILVEDMENTGEVKTLKSEWLKNRPEEQENRKIIEQVIYEYKDLKKIRYIKINNIINNSVSEIAIYEKANRIDYQASTKSQTNVDIINNKNTKDYITLEESDEIIIDLKREVNINDLNILFSTYAPNQDYFYFRINLLGEENEAVYAFKETKSALESNYGSYYTVSSHFRLKDPVYEEAKLSLEKPSENKFRQISQVLGYQYEDTYIKYIKKEKEYLMDYYLDSIDGYEIDLDSKKEFYYKKSRDKVEIADKLVIEDYDAKLEDFILDKTVDDIKITSNVNYYKNGEYDINFILPFRTVKSKVIVDIKENYLKTLKYQNEHLKELEQDNTTLNVINNNLTTNLKEVLTEKDKIIEDTSNQIVKYKSEIEMLKDNKIDFEKTETSKYAFFKYGLLGIIIVLTVCTIFIQKKSY